MSQLSERQQQIEDRIQRAPEEVQLAFWAMIADGQSQTMAEMLAWQQSPLMRGSDRSFNDTSRHTMEEKMKGAQMKKILAMAKKAGISTQGKYYKGGLGRPTDPMAWVSTTDDIQEVVRAKNLNCDGVVTHKARPVEPKPRPKMAKDIVDQYVSREMMHPKTAEQVKSGKLKRKDLEAKVIEKHTKQ